MPPKFPKEDTPPGTTTSPKPEGSFSTIPAVPKVPTEPKALDRKGSADSAVASCPPSIQPGAPMSPVASTVAMPVETRTPATLSSTLAKQVGRIILASLPSVLFAGLSLGNVSSKLYGSLSIGAVGMTAETVIYPLACYLVNLATAHEEQYHYAQSIPRLWAPGATYKDRIAFAGTNIIAMVAAVATIPMALDAAKTMNMTSENPHVNLAFQATAIICMSILYTVVTRQTAAFSLIFKEIPDFFRWMNRKGHLLWSDSGATYFQEDVIRFMTTDMKTDTQYRVLKDFLENDASSHVSDSTRAEIIARFLTTVGYRPFPSVTKTLITSTLIAGTPLLGFLLNQLSYEGAVTLGLPDMAAKIVAGASTTVTGTFYVRACMKFFDRYCNAYRSVREAYFSESLLGFIAFIAFFTTFLVILTIATSAGFVFEARKYTEDYSRVVQELYKFCWTLYAGLIANGGYTLLQMGNIAQAKLDATVKTSPQHNDPAILPVSSHAASVSQFSALLRDHLFAVQRNVFGVPPMGLSESSPLVVNA